MSLSPTVAAYAQHWIANLTYDLSRYAMFAIAVWLVICVLLRVPLARRKLRETSPAARQLIVEFATSLRTVAIFSTVGLIAFTLERVACSRGRRSRCVLAWAGASRP
jgi:hypothetical protein